MRTVVKVVWCDDVDGRHLVPGDPPGHQDILELRCELHLAGGGVARVAVRGRAFAAIRATCGRDLARSQLRQAAERFYRSRIEDIPLDVDPAYCFDYDESVNGICHELASAAG